MKAIALTNVGNKRSMNQDFYYCSDEPVGILPNLYIVADGMGGHNAGDFASRFSVERFVNLIRESKERTPISAIEAALKTTNEELIAKAKTQREYEGMGTTFVMATLLSDGYLLIANIGDSRLYIVNDRIQQITEDHSLVGEMVRNGELKKDEARFHPQKNVVLRALSTRTVVSPDFYKIRVNRGDYILLCSDGLWEMVEEGELLKLVSEYEDVSDIAEKMVFMANENGGKDNITIILMKV
ncbi:MAG: Stp1/IreP family PP2C-type Ser/Thr phosphatase [Lachnospiraceae bacterium]|jgi:protein phosphatase|nr:Stp1/IreP family PP2C-type Ser/Thr phosphatase [Lachnospiraceae bacterium]MBO4668417.1 Stp1/IreP family PP2C-type Ser/Thr phosphatase [Lachnospiraceae bacterium]MBQ1852591.1 Stp1/IreP family PP2C-type Ser/Thr phosphatase [Lachnospiraceae bacterium]MBR5667837.1 Stp1/IreP family PP2C-type Ser/Thr phosphatase [Lachnospiraceae bacterium]MCR5467055.1 Stp1/IreP family PP2C-type Ser/Thr phosphatase [Lachnospiraceae bacterium]